VENKVPIGLVRHLPAASSAWAEVERHHVPINRVDVRRGLIFGDLAQHYAEHELAETSESIRPKDIFARSTSMRTNLIAKRQSIQSDNMNI